MSTRALLVVMLVLLAIAILLHLGPEAGVR